MKQEIKFEYLKLSDLTPYERNTRNHDRRSIDSIKSSIRDTGMNDPIGVWGDKNIIVEGHGRYLACKELGIEIVPVLHLDYLTDEERRKYAIAHNRTTELSEFNQYLKLELDELNFECPDLHFEEIIIENENNKVDNIVEDEAPEIDEYNEPVTKLGDIWQLGNHRLMCGDSTDKATIEKLMNGVKADLVFTDPPYGMKKEKDGVLNDNLNFNDLLEFNKKWIPLTFDNLKNNGSWYCWGTDEPLMDIYAFILKPMIKENKITFRNLITWDKGNGQGQLSADFRMYPIADEKCLFIQVGIQALTLNADQYWERYEPIRKYLYDSRIAMGWDVPTMKKIVGHSDLSRDHWTSKSQFNMPTREVYEKMKAAAEKQRQEQGINNDAFRREYDDLRREYDDLRAYFDNTHDNMNNVWHFDRTSNQEKELTGNHATPKPIALCARAIKSSSRENEIVLDVFGGSGSTLIACEQLNRKCYMVELDPRYVQVILERYIAIKGTSKDVYRINADGTKTKYADIT